jgi:hypothetical protein
MPKRVPANLADADTHGGGFDVPSQNALLPAWLPIAVRKYPVEWGSVSATLPVCPEGISQTRINRKRKPRGFCLRIADSAVDNTSPHQQREVSQLKSPHCKPMISLARRPRQAAIRTIVR